MRCREFFLAVAFAGGVGALASAASARDLVRSDLGYKPGTIVIVNGEHRLYYVTGKGKAMRGHSGIRHGMVGKTRSRKRKLQGGTLLVAIDRTRTEVPKRSQACFAHTEILRAKHGVRLAVQASRSLACQVSEQAPEPQVNLSVRIHDGGIELREGLHQFRFPLHRKNAVGGESQRRQEEVEMRLQLRRAFGGQWLETGHGNLGADWRPGV